MKNNGNLTHIQLINVLEGGKLGSSIKMISSLLDTDPWLADRNRLEEISEEYTLMLDFMRRGYADEKRQQLYERLINKTYQLAADMELMWRQKNRMVYAEAKREADGQNNSHDFIKSVLEAFVADLGMLSLENEHVREDKLRALHERHQRFMQRLFAQLFLSPQWSEWDYTFYRDLILSPTIDTNDAAWILSAITINCINQFDFRKHRMFGYIYKHSNSERIKQRALVAWAFTLSNIDFCFSNEMKEDVKSFIADEKVRKELLELQIQVFFCMNAEKDHQEIQNDIMPTLMKNQNFEVTRFGIVEKEEDPMQDILYPDAADKAMEDLEKSIQRMTDMQKAGSDIYFGGFSQMKRFSFFSSLANWFAPFYIENPVLENIKGKLKNSRFLSNLLHHGPFCDSDKYSFSLAISDIIEKLPQQIRELLNTEEAVVPIGGEADDSHAFIRRMYLQDLYRFYKLYPRRTEFANPFNYSEEYLSIDSGEAYFFANITLIASEMRSEREQLGFFLLKNERWNDLERLFFDGENEKTWSISRFVLEGQLAMYRGEYDNAITYFMNVLKIDAQNFLAKKMLANAFMESENYHEAAVLYDELSIQYPHRKSFVLNKSIALLRQNKTGEALDELYRLIYENPNDDRVKSVLAWALLVQKKTDNARKIYDELLKGNPMPQDLLNAGYCYWFLHEMDEAIKLFKRYNEQHRDTLESAFINDRELLDAYGISQAEESLMKDLIDEPLS